MIGFIGLGSIGLPIAKNLISAGYSLKIHTKSRKSENHKELKSAIPCSSPKELVIGCSVVFICVSDDKAIEEVLFSLDYGAYKNLEKDSTIVDLSTISPSKAKSNAKLLARKKIHYIDGPISGGTERAESGKLSIFLGCNENFYNKIYKLIEVFASKIYLFDSVGKGQEVKLINQILVAGSYAAVAEAIAIGEKLNLKMDDVIKALETGAASSWALSNRSRTMLKNEYPLGFKLSLHHKDLSIALDTASELGIKLPITTKVKEIEEGLINKGYGNDDISVIRRAF